MKRFFIFYIIIAAVIVGTASLYPVYATEFTMTVTIKNKSDNWKKFFLKKGRIIEIAKVDASHYQNIILTEGDGLILIPPLQTVKQTIKGICLQEGLNLPPKNAVMKLTPFVLQEEWIDKDQKTMYTIMENPLDNSSSLIGKGYSDAIKNERQQDREEAFQSAVLDVSRQIGIIFESKSVFQDLSLVHGLHTVTIDEQSITLNRIIHEEYNEDTGEYFFIGEFTISKKAPLPRLAR